MLVQFFFKKKKKNFSSVDLSQIQIFFSVNLWLICHFRIFVLFFFKHAVMEGKWLYYEYSRVLHNDLAKKRHRCNLLWLLRLSLTRLIGITICWHMSTVDIIETAGARRRIADGNEMIMKTRAEYRAFVWRMRCHSMHRVSTSVWSAAFFHCLLLLSAAAAAAGSTTVRQRTDSNDLMAVVC